jgi:hypothetical protein
MSGGKPDEFKQIHDEVMLLKEFRGIKNKEKVTSPKRNVSFIFVVLGIWAAILLGLVILNFVGKYFTSFIA